LWDSLKKGVKMNQTIIKMSMVTALCVLGTNAMAGGDIAEKIVELKTEKPKMKINGNMTVDYLVLPGSVESVGEMFSEGIFYGRLRSNTFYWDWDVEKEGKRKDNRNMGVGGNILFKTGVLNGFSATFGYYGSLNPGFFRMAKDEVQYAKAGKDTFSRYKVKTSGHYGLYSMAQMYMEYHNETVDIRAGRQLFESVFTASNDTKMIPNSFDGVSMGVGVAPKTKARVAWFGKQKLRDHENSHDVITFKDENGESWNNNDDSAVHKGLSYAKFVAAGEDTDHDLFIADLKTKYIKNLVAKLSYLQVPGVVKDVVAEAYYKIPFENGWALRPGIRYFYQMDDGGGAVAGYTNLTGKTATGYDAGVANSLDSNLFAARADILMPNKKGFFRLGYSKVADKADIVAPWRGFPTGGFTRAMGQYNWYANTETFLIRGVYKFTPKLKASLRYAIQNFDNAKDNVQADSTVWNLDAWYNFTDRFQMKARLGIANADDDIAKSLGGVKDDVSYTEYRLEFNYLF